MLTGKHPREACQGADPPIPYRNVKHQHAASHADWDVFPFLHQNVLLINHPLAVAKTEATLPYATARRDGVSGEIIEEDIAQPPVARDAPPAGGDPAAPRRERFSRTGPSDFGVPLGYGDGEMS